jgi:putative oxidoreductase
MTDDHLKRFTPLLGRLLLSALFLVSGTLKIVYWNGTLQGLTALHVPAAPFMLALAVFAELAGGFAVLAGFLARVAAALLFLYMIPVTLLFHAFWASPAAQQGAQMIQFLKNLAIMGGLLLLAAGGPGPLTLRLKRGTTPPPAQQ